MRFVTKFFPVLIMGASLNLHPSSAGVLDAHLRRLLLSVHDEQSSRSAQPLQRLSSATKHKLTRPGFITLQDVTGDNQNNDRSLRGSSTQTPETITTVSVLMEVNDLSTVDELKRKGVLARTVLPNGIVTADVPVSVLSHLSERHDVGLVEAAHPLRLSNDVANSLQAFQIEPRNGEFHKIYNGMNNTRSRTGKGVIVGVFDTGLDWTHQDFIDDNGNSRILYYWDQTDTKTNKSVTGDGWAYDYGREYTYSDFNAALSKFNNTWDPETNAFAPVTDPHYPIAASARDVAGHGTHVMGSAAGNGRGSGKMGVAFEASIIFVKTDFASDATMVDGVNYIFQRAAELNMSAVVNLSLGSSYGSHDGSSLSARAIDALIGPGRIVVAAAGNEGSINGINGTLPALHASGNMLNNEAITIQVPNFTVGEPELCSGEATDEYPDNYVFLDLWYNSRDSCAVQITSPSGVVYPKVFDTITGNLPLGLDTAEGYIYLSNGHDADYKSRDNNLYIYISDSVDRPLAQGTWKVELLAVGHSKGGKFDVWFGASDSILYGWYEEGYLRDPTPLIGTRQTDNKMTIDSPGDATKVIAVGAYTSRTDYAYFDPLLGEPESLAYYAARLGELAPFSSRGPRRDGLTKPDITAPGMFIISAFSHFVRHDEWSRRKSSYDSCKTNFFQDLEVSPDLESAVIAGTSCASPNVAGAVALLLEIDSTLNHEDVKRILKKSAIHDYNTDTFELYWNTKDPTETDSDSSPKSPNEDWGVGKIDIDAALAALEAR